MIAALPKLMIGVSVHDQNGKLIKQFKRPGHSWVRNAYNYLLTCMSDVGGDLSGSHGAGYLSARRMAGDIYHLPSVCQNRGSANVVSDSNGIVPSIGTHMSGIVCGSGVGAFSINNYNLSSLIYHGDSSGRLTYGGMSSPSKNYSDKAWTITHTRNFENESGGTVYIREFGLFRYVALYTGSIRNFLMARDVLDSEDWIALEDGQNVDLEYEMIMDFSSID